MMSLTVSTDKAEIRHLRVCSILVPVFLASGATSLIYETIWAHQLQLVFGTSQLAICTVLAVFMGGLSLGGFLSARWAGRITRPLVVFGLLEAAIGLYALIFGWLVELVIPVNLEIWRALEPEPVAHGAIRALLLGLLLLFPTTCMGATLPLLVRFTKARNEAAGSQVGRLYGANTIGAVLGTALGGFALLPWLGLAHTTWGTAFASGLIALAAFALARAANPTPTDRDRRDAQGDGDVRVCG